MRLHCPTLALAATLAALGPVSASAATLFAVDLGSSRGTASGPDAQASAANPLFAAADVYTVFSPGTVTSGATALVDQDGNATAASLSVEALDTGSFFFSNAGGRTDEGLRFDYLVGNRPDLGSTEISASIQLTFSGLDATRRYAFYVAAADTNVANRQAEVSIDTDGDGTLDTDTLISTGDSEAAVPVAVQDAYFASVLASADGEIIVQVDGVGAKDGATEINLAGLFLADAGPAPIPLPAPAALLLGALGALGLARRQRTARP